MNEKFYIEAKAQKIDKNIENAIKKSGILYPHHTLGFFKATYAKVDGKSPNGNGVILAESVKEDVPYLIGCQCNMNHYRRNWILGSIIDAYVTENDEIEIIFTFDKSIYEAEYKEALELMKDGKLTVSFELSVKKEDIEIVDGYYKKLNKVDFCGVGVLFGLKPAYKNAYVLESAMLAIEEALNQEDKQLVYASVKDISKKWIKIGEMIELAINNEEYEEAKKWTVKYINALPNSSFAVIEPAYLNGDTDDKRARHLPFKDKNGKVDLAHYRNALARANQIKPITDSISTEELRKKAQKELEKYKDVLKGNEENKMDKKANDALLAKLKKMYAEEFGEDVIKDWSDADFENEEKIKALRESLKKEETKEQVAEEEVKEDEKKEEEATVEEKEEVAEQEEAQKVKREIETVQKVTDVYDDEANTEEIKVEVEQVRKVDDKVKETVSTVENRVYNYAEVEEIKADYEAKIKEQADELAKKEEAIAFYKENAQKVVKIRAELGDFVKDLSDEELFDELKMKIARLEKENAELKAKKIEVASDEKSEENDEVVEEEKNDEKEEMDTGHVEVEEEVEESSEDRIKAYVKTRYKK